MKTGYFPKTDIEYEYYFNIDAIKKAKKYNCDRYAELCNFSNDIIKTQLNETLNKIAHLDDILLKIIDKENINDYETFYSHYNSALLINSSIEQFLCSNEFKQPYTKTMNLSNDKKSLDSLFFVGNILAPRGKIISSLIANSTSLFALLLIAISVAICIYIVQKGMGLAESYIYSTLYFIGMLIIVAISHIIIFAIRKIRIKKIKYQFTYYHYPINNDFFFKFVDRSVQNKVDSI